MSSSSAQIVFQGPAEQEENGRKPFVFKRVLDEARQDPKEIIADFCGRLRKAKALFLLRESREPGCISLTYRKGLGGVFTRHVMPILHLSGLM